MTAEETKLLIRWRAATQTESCRCLDCVLRLVEYTVWWANSPQDSWWSANMHQSLQTNLISLFSQDWEAVVKWLILRPVDQRTSRCTCVWACVSSAGWMPLPGAPPKPPWLICVPCPYTLPLSLCVQRRQMALGIPVAHDTFRSPLTTLCYSLPAHKHTDQSVMNQSHCSNYRLTTQSLFWATLMWYQPASLSAFKPTQASQPLTLITRSNHLNEEEFSYCFMFISCVR